MLLNHKRLLGALIIQCYDRRWLEICRHYGISNVVVALWKHFGKNPTGDAAYGFAKYAVENFNVFGITIRWKIPGTEVETRLSETIDRFHALGDVYFHNQDIPLYQEKRLTAEGLNFFSAFSLGSLPAAFDPERYRSLHDDLAGMNDLEVACHYLQFGGLEGREY
ncbi:MAG: hypothetical protein KGM42_18030 [Hyphomicrobiales bacterium]|nr:hypothetical protein [Hyphomicrobiales bacterium]